MGKDVKKQPTVKKYNSRTIQQVIQLDRRDKFLIEKKYKGLEADKATWEKLLK